MHGDEKGLSDVLRQDLARRFAFHADIYGGKSPGSVSPLYEYLSHQVAADPEILSLVAEADRLQQVTHLLFGAVHFLMLSGAQHPLREFYASLAPQPRLPQDA